MILALNTSERFGRPSMALQVPGSHTDKWDSPLSIKQHLLWSALADQSPQEGKMGKGLLWLGEYVLQFLPMSQKREVTKNIVAKSHWVEVLQKQLYSSILPRNGISIQHSITYLRIPLNKAMPIF